MTRMELCGGKLMQFVSMILIGERVYICSKDFLLCLAL